MSKLSVTTTATTEIELTPKVQHKLKLELAEYARLDVAYKLAKEERDAKLADIEDLRESVDAKSFKFEGATITRVEGVSKSLDKKKLVQLGCAMAWIEEATTTKSKKAYTKVTLAGDKEADGDE